MSQTLLERAPGFFENEGSVIDPKLRHLIVGIRTMRNQKHAMGLTPVDDESLAKEIECRFELALEPIIQEYIRAPLSSTTLFCLQQKVDQCVRAILDDEDFSWYPDIEELFRLKVIVCRLNKHQIHFLREGIVSSCGCVW